jgi:hypothetical protein
VNKPELLKELRFRKLEHDERHGVRNPLGLFLKAAGESRLKEELAADLLTRGSPSEGMKVSSMIVLLKHDCAEKSESTVLVQSGPAAPT